MSSTFALPTTLLATVRAPRMRRRAVHAAQVAQTEQTAHAAETAVPIVGTDEAREPVNALPFLRTPSTWQLAARRPVSYLDHVAVAPAGVLAITTRHYLEVEDDAHVQRAWQDIRTAKGAAKLLELTLDDESVPVRAVLVLWGPGAPEMEKGYLTVKGVTVVDPARPEAWSHLFDSPALDELALAVTAHRIRTLQTASNDTPIELAV